MPAPNQKLRPAEPTRGHYGAPEYEESLGIRFSRDILEANTTPLYTYDNRDTFGHHYLEFNSMKRFTTDRRLGTKKESFATSPLCQALHL